MEESRLTTRVLGLICFTFLVVACYGGALFGGGQFAFRDAAHFYYPLYYRVQQEWAAGHLPLWEPRENGGMPLLGSPMAAVLYPGKIFFAILPYAWGVRFYIVAHEFLAFGAMLALTRSWGVSWTGAFLAGLCFAFGGPILSNYFNVIYLVGAAWAPLGFRAVDRWLRLGQRSALPQLALVLAMQVLGGDPEAAYITALCAFGYAVSLAGPRQASPGHPWFWFLGVVAVLIGWIWVGPVLASWIHGRGTRWGQAILIVAWAFAIILYMASQQREHRARLGRMLLGVAAACFLAIALAAAQVFPVVDHIATSIRWTGAGITDLYDSSLLPYRVLEWIWPNVFGSFAAGNRYWMILLPPSGAHRPWPLSLYLGALPLVLAFGVAGFRNGPPWRAWMTAVVLLSFLASLGEFAGPSRWLGDELTPTPGDQSFYGLLATTLPCLRLFRLPFKLLVFTSLGLAALAGMGWDRITSRQSRSRVIVITTVLLSLTILLLTAVVSLRSRLAVAMAASPQAISNIFGPLDTSGAVTEILRSLGQGMVALSVSLVLVGCSRRYPAQARFAALCLLTIDLAMANAGLVITIPQTDFEQMSEAVQAIRAAERANNPSLQPFRIHRLASWVPSGWSEEGSTQRLRELVDWEIDTLQPRFGVVYGMSYLLSDESETVGAEYSRLFQPSFRSVSNRTATLLGVEPGRRVLWHPRRAFDLWGTRYFILPSYPAGWTSPNRSYAAFVDQTEMIYPDPSSLEGPEHRQNREHWVKTRDVQVRRNLAAFPRAWVVHQARLIRPLEQLTTAMQGALLERLGHADGDAHDEPRPTTLDLRTGAYVETDHPESLASYLPGTGQDPTESVTVRYESSTRVLLDAHLQRAGLIILADIFDRGWKLQIDGKAAPILRANMMMRAALVPAGSHALVYTYQPYSLQLGALFSIAGLAILLGLFLWCLSRPVEQVILEAGSMPDSP